MPENWAASGGRLPFSIDVEVESDYSQQRDAEENFMGKGALLLTVLEDASFVSNEGEQVIGISEGGGWKLQMPKQKGNAGTLRLWVDLERNPELGGGLSAVRNDVTLPAERLYFMTKCWREADFEIGRKKMKPFEDAAKLAQERLDQELSHETGDRRLDGTNLADTAMGSINMANLVRLRDEKVQELREASETLPRNADKLPLGFWPGTTEKLAICSKGTVAVKRKKFFREEFHVLGRWTAVPVQQEE